MKTIQWTNSTSLYPGGVCEAAAIIWLKTIKKSGIETANKIKALDCDGLQSRVEAGEFTWYLDLKSETLCSTFDPDGGKNYKNNKVIENDISDCVFDELKDQGKFIFISANRSGAAHAMALYRDSNKIYYFDPNNAIYEVDTTKVDMANLEGAIKTNCIVWDNVVLRYGTI